MWTPCQCSGFAVEVATLGPAVDRGHGSLRGSGCAMLPAAGGFSLTVRVAGSCPGLVLRGPVSRCGLLRKGWADLALPPPCGSPVRPRLIVVPSLGQSRGDAASPWASPDPEARDPAYVYLMFDSLSWTSESQLAGCWPALCTQWVPSCVVLDLNSWLLGFGHRPGRWTLSWTLPGAVGCGSGLVGPPGGVQPLGSG